MIKLTRIFVSFTFKHPFRFTHHMCNHVAYIGIESKEGQILHFNSLIRTISGFIGIQSFPVINCFWSVWWFGWCDMICASLESISLMGFLPVLPRPFRLGSNLTPSAFANDTSFIIPWIIELRVPSGILISFRSFEMMPPFPPQGWFLVASYLFKNTNPTVYLTANAWSKRGFS